jgi:hypothetical protein
MATPYRTIIHQIHFALYHFHAASTGVYAHDACFSQQ